MKKSIILFIVAAVTVTSFALTHAETNEVLKTFSMLIYDDGGWSPDVFKVSESGVPYADVDDDPDAFRLDSYEELFSKYPSDCFGASLTPQERRDIFEATLWGIPNLPTNSAGRGLNFGGDLIRFCAKHNQTNFLPLAEQILLSPRAQWVPEARKFFEKFAKPSEETYRFMECMMTNRPNGLMTLYQAYIFSSFGKVLRNNKSETDPCVLSNGVRLAYRFIEGQGQEGANTFDVLMRMIDPDYAMSSNRLTFAITALNAPKRHDIYTAQKFFGSITNTLLNASEPLKVLDLSWLDESVKAPL